jgi:hypothetical protein
MASSAGPMGHACGLPQTTTAAAVVYLLQLPGDAVCPLHRGPRALGLQ